MRCDLSCMDQWQGVRSARKSAFDPSGRSAGPSLSSALEMKPGLEMTDLDAQKNRLATLLKTRSDLYFESSEGSEGLLLGPVSREFFSTYRRISTRNRSLEVASELISDSEHFEGCISIGHYEYWEIVVRPGLDCVYVVDGSEDGLDRTDAVYPTIYHYLVSDLQLL